jgi:hypothetical protein
MKNTIKQLKKDFESIERYLVFEVEVIDKRTKKNDWILFDVSIQKNTLVAQHIALTEKEEKSRKIANKRVVLDTDYSIDMHLETLFEICNESIMDSDYYEHI